MKIKRILAVCIAVAIAIAIFLPGLGLGVGTPGDSLVAKETGTDGISADVLEKDEVVYATLDANGAANAIYVVNHFSVVAGGTVQDYGDYSSVVNLTNTDPLTQSGDSVTFQANEDDFYYQGNLNSTDLPWIFDISYYMDGTQLQPDEIAGKSGKLELKITSRPDEKVDATFYDNYMLQITVTLDTQKTSNIDAPDGTTASAGKNTIIAYTVLPGSDADFTLTANVQDFEMTGISISGVPYSMSVNFPDTDAALGDLEKLPEAITELNDGVGELKNGTQEMQDGVSGLKSGAASIEAGLNTLSNNAGTLQSGSTQINDALAQIAASLDASGLDDLDLSQLTELPASLTGLSDGLKGISAGLVGLKDNFNQAYEALDKEIQAIPTVDPAKIAALSAAVYNDPTLSGYLNELVAAYTAAQRVKGVYEKVQGGFEAVGTTVDTLTGHLKTMTDQLDQSVQALEASLAGMGDISQLSELVSGLGQLSAKYGEFNAGLQEYLSGVNALAANYSAFNAGVASLSDGVGELNSGVGELYDGTDTLNEEISDLPDMIQEEIDKMKEDYMPSEFEPISFTSSKNTDTTFVQFVLQCAEIKKPDEPEETDAVDQSDESFWDRLMALFKSGD